MSIITDQNRDSLLKNPNVKNLTGKQIVYTSKFIQSALKRYGEGGSARIIWLDAGFEIESFKKGYFRKCLNRWKSQLINGNVSPLVRGKSKIDFQRIVQIEVMDQLTPLDTTYVEYLSFPVN